MALARGRHSGLELPSHRSVKAVCLSDAGGGVESRTKKGRLVVGVSRVHVREAVVVDLA